MKGLCKKIGKLNARFVPIDNKNYYPQSLNKWLRKLLFYKLGYPIPNPIWRNNFSNDHFTSLISNNTLRRPIPSTRFTHLYSTLSHNLNNPPPNIIAFEFDDLVQRYPDMSLNNHWIIPPKVYDTIIKHFDIAIERCSTPFTFHLGLNSYSSMLQKDKLFGSLGNSHNNLWSSNSILTPKFETETIYKSVAVAINSSYHSKNSTFIFLPLWNDNLTLKFIMNDKKLRLICKWPSSSKLISPITYDTVTYTHEIGLFATNLKAAHLPPKFIDDINNISLSTFGSLPLFNPNTDNLTPHKTRNSNIYPKLKYFHDIHIPLHTKPEDNSNLTDIYLYTNEDIRHEVGLCFYLLEKLPFYCIIYVVI